LRHGAGSSRYCPPVPAFAELPLVSGASANAAPARLNATMAAMARAPITNLNFLLISTPPFLYILIVPLWTFSFIVKLVYGETMEKCCFFHVDFAESVIT
jgi:hypothetical protein